MRPEDRKALFFDVDGTLMGEDGCIPQSASKALKEARRAGHLVFINSGRIYQLAKYIENEVEADGLLCGCGTDLRIGGKQVYSYHLPGEIAREIRKDYETFSIDVFLEGEEGTIPSPKLSRRDSIETVDFIKAQGGGAPYAFEDERYPLNKFCALDTGHSDMEGFRAKYSRWFDLIDRGGGFFECVPLGHDKGFAVKKTLELCGIREENAYVFGDSTNDIGMLRAVRHAIIMGKHDKVIEPYAEFVTKRVEEDGIAYALRHYGIIPESEERQKA